MSESEHAGSSMPGTPNTPSLVQLSLRKLLSSEELALLHTAPELGGSLSVMDLEGEPIVGEKVPLEWLRSFSSGTPHVCQREGRCFLGTTFFHDGQEFAYIVCELSDEPSSRAKALKTAHYLIRMTETMLCAAVRRTLMSRLHRLAIEEAHLELQQKSQSLHQAVARMKDTEGVKASFLATISHELRTPLTSVIGYTEMMLEGLAGPVTSEQHEYLETILAKSEQLHQLISKLIDVSRLEVSSVQLQCSTVDVKSLLGEVVRGLGPQLRRKRTRLRLSIDENLPMLHADRDKLRQVFQNLLGNAVKFTRDEGEIVLGAERSVSNENLPNVLVSVCDNGIGIPAHLRDKVFDAFYQVDNSSTRQHEGSGLGLHLVRRYIVAHGGKVWIEDRQQGGTIFRVMLPEKQGDGGDSPRSE